MARFCFHSIQVEKDEIMQKINKGDIDYIKQFFDVNTVKINQANSWGKSCLMASCEYGNRDIINFLIEAGSDLDMSDKDGRTALHYAVSRCQHDAVSILISRGANVNSKDKYCDTPLHWAAWSGQDIVRVLLRTQGKTTLQINQHDNIGRTPLHWACLQGHTNTVHLLLNETGINANVTDDYYNTPLHRAIEKQHYDVVTLMLSQVSVALDIKNHNKMTPLLLAVCKGHLGMVQKLIAKGADINAVDDEGNNCLHLAVKTPVFHSKGASSTILDECCTELKLNKETRLSGVVVARYLASQGAKFCHKNDNNKTPLDLIENQDLKDNLQTFLPPRCHWCEKNVATRKFQPCGHTALCTKCSEIPLNQCLKCCQTLSDRNGFETPKSVDKQVQTMAPTTKHKSQQVEGPKLSDKEVQTVPESVGIPELMKKDLLRVAKRLGGKWQRAGIFLDIETYQLDVIKHDYPHDTVEQGFQMLMYHKWYISCDQDMRIPKTLREALEEAECFDALACLPQTK